MIWTNETWYARTSASKLIISVTLVRVLVTIIWTTSIKTVGTVGTVHSLTKENEKTGERETLRATSADISKGNLESAGFTAAGGTEEATQVPTLSCVLIQVSALKNCSATAFDNGCIRIFIAGILIRILSCHFAIATWGRGDTTSCPLVWAGLAVRSIVVKGLRTEVSAHISSWGRQFLHTNGLLATYAT